MNLAFLYRYYGLVCQHELEVDKGQLRATRFPSSQDWSAWYLVRHSQKKTAWNPCVIFHLLQNAFGCGRNCARCRLCSDGLGLLLCQSISCKELSSGPLHGYTYVYGLSEIPGTMKTGIGWRQEHGSRRIEPHELLGRFISGRNPVDSDLAQLTPSKWHLLVGKLSTRMKHVFCRVRHIPQCLSK